MLLTFLQFLLKKKLNSNMLLYIKYVEKKYHDQPLRIVSPKCVGPQLLSFFEV